MIACIIIIGIAALLTVWYVICKCQKFDLKELFIKTGISVLFMIVALIASTKSNNFSLFNAFVLGGLLLGLVGDILLDLKYVDREREDGYTYGGFIAFGIGHLLYMAGLIYMFLPTGRWWLLFIALALDVLLSIATIVLEKPMKLEYGKMKKISFAYALCLFGTLSLSLVLAINNRFGSLALNTFFVGAALFAISDLVLSGTYFGKGKDRPIDYALNYAFYYGAQFTIAFLLLFI